MIYLIRLQEDNIIKIKNKPMSQFLHIYNFLSQFNLSLEFQETMKKTIIRAKKKEIYLHQAQDGPVTYKNITKEGINQEQSKYF